MIPQRFIEEVQARTDIADLIASYIPLKKTGRNFKALCPFHNEKTASFIVSQQKQIFHCFGCGEGGGVIQFLMLLEKVSFVEAIEILAHRLGLQIPYQRSSPQERTKTLLYEIVNEASQFFFENLIHNARAQAVIQWLHTRGIIHQVIHQFKIGYSPYDNLLLAHMRKKGYSLELLEKASLVTFNKEAGYRDLFRGRIMLPIIDIKGRVIGFGARIVKDKENIPKYINSLENPLYAKREQLYGLHISKEEIIKKDSVIVVEGYFDMIVPYSQGIHNIVASLGTALTQEQIRSLKRYTRNVILVYDADKAGEFASLRALDLLLENDLNIRIVKLPSGHDPDSLVRAEGKERFMALLSQAVDFFDYKIEVLRSIYDVGSIEGKTKVAHEMLLTIDKMVSEVAKFEYLKRLASALNVKEEVLLLELRKSKSSTGITLKEQRHNVLKEPIPITEKVLIQFMIQNKKARDIINKNLKEEDFLHPLTRKTASWLLRDTVEFPQWSVTALLGIIEDREVSRFISQLSIEESIPLNKELFKECIVKLRSRRITAFKAQLKKELKDAEAQDNRKKIKELMLRYKEINSEIRR